MDLTIEDLKTIRLALSSYALSTNVINALTSIDNELAKHNLKAEYRRLPKRKYQRDHRGEYVFININ